MRVDTESIPSCVLLSEVLSIYRDNKKDSMCIYTHVDTNTHTLLHFFSLMVLGVKPKYPSTDTYVQLSLF